MTNDWRIADSTSKRPNEPMSGASAGRARPPWALLAVSAGISVLLALLAKRSTKANP